MTVKDNEMATFSSTSARMLISSWKRRCTSAHAKTSSYAVLGVKSNINQRQNIAESMICIAVHLVAIIQYRARQVTGVLDTTSG